MATTAEQARAIRKHAADEMTAVRDSRDLSDQGRQRQLARITQRRNDQLRALRVTEQRDLEDRRETLVRQLFRNPTPRDAASVVSYRDAQDRAAAVTGEKAVELYRRAVRTGDELLARALAVRAAERGSFGGSGWSEVLDHWAGHEPGARDVLDELGQIAAADSPRGRFARSFATTGGGAPHELRGVPDVTRLAAQADTGGDAA